MKHGKKQFIDFRDDELQELRKYFNYLDKDKGGSISAEELEEPMIALGFAETREDVQMLINAIDKNGNGEIELDEFLTIIKSGKVCMACPLTVQQGAGGPPIGQFFKKMINGEFSKGQMTIPLYISDYRRKMIIQSMFGGARTDKTKAKKIAQAFERQMTLKHAREREEKGLDDPSDNPTTVSAAHLEDLQQKLNSNSGMIMGRVHKKDGREVNKF